MFDIMLLLLTLVFNHATINSNRKGKPGESRGRKTMGLTPLTFKGYDCQVAEVKHI